jgi:hypothetical protein
MRRATILLILMLLAIACKHGKPFFEPIVDILEVESDSFELNYEEQTITLAFSANVEVNIDVDADWIERVDSRGMESHEVSFMVAENDTAEKRKASITITAGSEEHIVTIVQMAAPDRMLLKLTHQNDTLSSPLWYGDDVTGRVEWGDGEECRYVEGVYHDYTSDVMHEALFDMRGADGFHIESIEEITDIEISVDLSL